jgi:hypothetical protein
MAKLDGKGEQVGKYVKKFTIWIMEVPDYC